jgi:CubicO group peptidase (beta-lactamase class C family)
MTWRSVVAILGIAVAAAGLVWRGGIAYLERVPPAPEASVPRCPGVLDSAFEGGIHRARRHLERAMADRRIPGLAVAVALDGRLIWSEGLGYADLDRATPACPTTQFRIQSVSKPVTAAGMARLYEAGLLDLDAPVGRYVPNLPPAIAAPTPRQLASHRAGIRHYRDDQETINTTRYATATASLEKFAGDAPLFQPDEDFTYSTYGFVLLAAAMEGATGLDFPTLMERWVLEPLGMRGTEAERREAVRAERATFYDYETPYSLDGTRRRSPVLDFSSKWAGGGLLSTAEDVARFGATHVVPHNRGFLRDETVAMLFRPRTKGLPLGYALGWMAGRDHRLRRVYAHTGAGSGGTSFLAVLPDQGVSVALLANLGHARYPIRTLLGITTPFGGDPYAPFAWLAIIGGVAPAAVLLIRRAVR